MGVRIGCGLSQLGYQFIAGILRHAKAICAVIAPTVNSYKRLIAQGSMSGFTWAPIFMCYGNNNRTSALRTLQYEAVVTVHRWCNHRANRGKMFHDACEKLIPEFRKAATAWIGRI